MKVSTSPQAGGVLRRIGNYSFSPSLLLGAGNFSKVYSGRNQTTGQAVAVKVVELQSLRTQRLLQLHRTQMDVLMKISHPHVLKCHQIINDDRQCYIVTEVCNGGDLDMFVKREGFLTEEKAAPFIKDVFEGLMYLAEVGVVHRDLKVANIFLHNGRAKIADFGFALFARQKFRDLSIGSPLYMSPEGFIDCIYGPKTDVWAFGIMIYQLLHGDTPYSSCKMENDLRYQLSLRFDRSKVKGTISNELKEVIFRCLEVDEGKRISIQELRDTNYFKRLYYYYSQHPQQMSLSPSHEDHRQGQVITPSSPHQLPPHHGLILVGRSLSNEGFKQLSSFESTKPSETHPVSRPVETPPSTPLFNNNKPVDIPPLLSTNKPIQALPPPSPISDRPKPPLLQPPRDVIRLGRPISTDKHMTRLQPPQASRERLKSIDSKKPVQKYIILTTVINFKAAVNLLHYCRGLFRCVQLMIGAGEGQSELKYLTGWLILVLQELNRKLNQGEVLFEGENGEMKAKKLREVRNEYERKYVNELKNYISSFINKPSLQDIKLYFFLQYRKYDIAIQQPASQAPLQLGHLVVLMYDGTRLLKKCQEEGNFARFLNYKDIQHMLGWTKDKFTLASYLAFKKRMIINA